MNSYDIFINDILPKLNTFDDFYKINGYTTKQIGDFFEIITKYIFLLHDNYKLIVDKVWLYDQIPNNLFKELNIPVRDKGIDLVILMKDRSYYAVQSKFRSDTNATIPWNDVSNFPAMLYVSGTFKGGFFVTNILEIDVEIDRSIQIVSFYGDLFDTLNKNFFDQIRAVIHKIPIIVHKPKPKRDYQIEFIDKCTEHFKTNTRGYGNIACGVGKTLMAYWYYRTLNPKFTIIGVPSLYLLSQFFKEWISEATADKHKLDFILVGSDADFKEEDYKNNGLLITTDEKEICKKMCNAIYRSNNNLVIITTYQSADKLLFASNALEINYDLCILDEAHKTCQQFGHQFSFLLDDNNLKIKKRLCMTATPRIYNNVGNDNEDIVSMDNKTIFGDEIFTYSIRQGINNKCLCDYQIMTLFTDTKFVDDYINKNKIISIEGKQFSSYYVACALMIIKSFDEHCCTHMITYHNTVKNSKELKKILRLLKPDGTINIQHMHGKNSIKKRLKKINSFETSKLSILTTAKVFNEGINIPVIDSVCFVDQRDSTIDLIQCIGRALRKCDGKTMAKILVPYFFEDINTLDDNFYFPKLVNVIKAISESDEEVKAYFTLKTTGKPINKPIIKHCNYLSNETQIIVNEKINLNEWINNIDISVWKRVDRFEFFYEQLKEHVERTGEFPKQLVDDKKEYNLNRMCNQYRQFKHLLTQSQIEKLESIKGWEWQKVFSLEEKYNMISEFITKNNKMPRRRSDDKDERRLAQLSSKVRKDKKENKLNIDYIDKFTNLKYWVWESEVIIFDDTVIELKEWVMKYGKYPSKRSTNPAEQTLGQFWSNQKQYKKRGKLSVEEQTQLEDLPNWQWIPEITIKPRSFEDNYNDVKEWIKKFNKIPNKRSADKNESKLGEFCSRVRRLYKHNNLDIQRKELFDKLGKIWIW